jgi:hypothetical protein
VKARVSVGGGDDRDQDEKHGKALPENHSPVSPVHYTGRSRLFR